MKPALHIVSAQQLAQKKYNASERGKETSRERSRKRREHYPAETMWYSARQRAKRDGIAFEISRDDIVMPTCCPVLGIELRRTPGCVGDNSPSLDRINPKLGYVRGNIAVMSVRANRIKNDATSEELALVLAWMRANERVKS